MKNIALLIALFSLVAFAGTGTTAKRGKKGRAVDAGVVAGASADAGVAELGRKELALKIGETQVVQVKQLRRVALGNLDLADVRVVSDSALEVQGKANGSTELQVWSDDGRTTYSLKVGTGLIDLPKAAGAKPGDAPAPVIETGDKIAVAVGKDTSFAVPGLSRIAVSDPAIADVKAEGESVRVIGVAPGRTELRVWDKENRKAQFIVEVR